MDYHPPFILFCALGIGVMAASAALIIAIEVIDNWLVQRSLRSDQHGRTSVSNPSRDRQPQPGLWRSRPALAPISRDGKGKAR